MKNLQQYSDPAFESLLAELKEGIEAKHSHIKEHVSPYLGKDTGRRNEPEVTCEDCEYCFEEMRGMYTSIYQDVVLKLNGNLQKLLGIIAMGIVKKETLELEKEKKESEELQRTMEDEQSRIPMKKTPQTFSGNNMFLAVIVVCEVFCITSAFMYFMRDRPFAALCTGLMAGLALATATSIGAIVYRDAKKKAVRRFMAWVAFPVVIAGSIAFGVFRYLQLEKDGAILKFDTPWFFVILGAVVTLATGIVAYFFGPSLEEILNQRKWKALDKKRKEEAKRSKALSVRIKEKNAEANKIGTYHLFKRNAQISLHDLVQAMYKEAVQIFKRANLRVRKGSPIGFKKKIEPLDLKIADEFFETDKSNEHEDDIN